MEDLERLTDLSAAHLTALQQIDHGHALQVNKLLLRQFIQDGLVEAANSGHKLTRHGADVLQRAANLFSGKWVPQPSIPEESINILSTKQGYRVARVIEKHLGVCLSGNSMKVLLHLSRSPNSYRWLCRIFGKESLTPPLEAGLVDGQEKRGSLWTITDAGKDLLLRAIPFLGETNQPGQQSPSSSMYSKQHPNSQGGNKTMITLSRVNLLDALKNGTPACGGTLPSAKFVRIEAKAADRVVMTTTFNGTTAIESIVAGDVADDMLVHVDAQTLLRLVTAMPEGAITLALKNNSLVLTASDAKFKNDLKIGGPDIEIPVIAGSTKTKMAKLTGVDFQYLFRAVKFASADEAKPKLMIVNVAFNQFGEKILAVSWAADGFSACQALAPVASCVKDAIGKDINFPASIVSQMVQVIRPDDEVEICRSGKSRYIVSVTNGKTGKNLTMASSESSEATPVDMISKVIKTTKEQGDVSMEIDTTSLASALDVITAFTTREEIASMHLSVKDGVIKYASDPTGSGQCLPSTLDGTASGPTTSRWFEPSFIRKAVSVMPEKTKAVMSSKPGMPILFMGDNIRVTVAPKSTRELEAIKFEEAIAVELPLEQPVVEEVAA